MIAARAVTIWLAVGSFDGLVEDDYYKQGPAVNQRLHAGSQSWRTGLRMPMSISGCR